MIAMLFACDSTQEKAETTTEEPAAAAPALPAAPSVGTLNSSLEKYPIAGFDYKSSAMPATEWQKWASTAAPAVNKIIATMPASHVLQVTGHTDSIGPEQPTGNKPGNIRISRDRAKTVYDALAKEGVDTTKMTYKGVGSSMPDPSYPTDDPRQRRVTFIIVPK